MRRYLPAALFLALFEAVAVTLWLTKGNLFYLLNFSYIGASLALGLALYARGSPHARRIVQLLVGGYMLGYLGLFQRENMQIEGFWYCLFTGAFEGAAIHYTVAKLAGPLLFGRGWCGYACWTAMVLDLLPYPVPSGERKPWGALRYVTFAASLLFSAALLLLPVHGRENVMFWAFLLGNLAYYAAGTALALRLRDNRAFCKYLCPVTVFLRPISRFALLRVKCDRSKCVRCGKCRAVCPMGLDPADGSRANAAECILCLDCTRACPKKAL